MSTNTKPRPQWVFDGCGINGSDEYRTRLATLTTEGHSRKCGPLMAAAPDLLEACNEALYDMLDMHGVILPDACPVTVSKLRNAIAKAKGK